MTTELRDFIALVFELILLGAIVSIVIMSSMLGRASLTEYVAQKEARNLLPEVVAYTKGSVGYYEVVDLIDTYAPTTEVTVTYKDNMGGYSTFTFTKALDGNVVKLALGTPLPQKGVDFTGIIYSRQEGILYRNGVQTTTSVMEIDMNLPYNSLKALNSLHGNGVLDYNFSEVLFAGMRDERFICVVTQTYETDSIDRITLDMQK